MKQTSPWVLDVFHREVIPLVIERYDLNEQEALRKFIHSETYALLLDEELGAWHFSPLAIFDIWENEIRTGDYTNSLYIRGDEI
ncbi:MAG: hypothetical protein FWF59_14745 [Turicibacter sp.]|nr:hypothetical protein [Turicibacter sp.]